MKKNLLFVLIGIVALSYLSIGCKKAPTSPQPPTPVSTPTPVVSPTPSSTPTAIPTAVINYSVCLTGPGLTGWFSYFDANNHPITVTVNGSVTFMSSYNVPKGKSFGLDLNVYSPTAYSYGVTMAYNGSFTAPGGYAYGSAPIGGGAIVSITHGVVQ